MRNSGVTRNYVAEYFAGPLSLPYLGDTHWPCVKLGEEGAEWRPHPCPAGASVTPPYEKADFRIHSWRKVERCTASKDDAPMTLDVLTTMSPVR